MKKVLLIASQPFFQWRGSPIRVGFNAMALAELGYQVDLLVLPVGEKREIPGVRIFRAPNLLAVKDVPIGPSLAKAAFDAIIFFQALGLAIENRYDILHCVEDAGPIGVAIAGFTGAKLIFEKHSDPSSHRKGPLRNLLLSLYAGVEKFAIRHADAAIGTGPGLAKQIRDVGAGKPVYDIFDIPSSLKEASKENTDQIRRKLKRSENEVLATFVGSFAVYQGVDLLFDAIPQVAKKRPETRFVIIGGTPDEIAGIKRRLAAQGAENAATFVGKIHPDELPDYLAASDILLSPRLAGVNTPLKLLDYLKACRPIVATDTESNRLILDEKTAALTKPEPSAFADGICRLASDAGARKTLGENGRRLIDRVYNYGEFKKRLGECYREVLQQSPKK